MILILYLASKTLALWLEAQPRVLLAEQTRNILLQGGFVLLTVTANNNKIY